MVFHGPALLGHSLVLEHSFAEYRRGIGVRPGEMAHIALCLPASSQLVRFPPARVTGVKCKALWGLQSRAG